MRTFIHLLAIASALQAVHANAADTTMQTTLTLEGAKRVMSAAVRFARERAAPGGAIAVVDAGGHVILVERLDGTFVAGADIAVGKARTAVAFKRPTRGIEETINKGRTAMTPLAAVTWFTPLQGGVPLMVGGTVVGGIGFSGASSAQQDEEIALAGAQALASPASSSAASPNVRYVPARVVQSAYRAGETGDTLVLADEYRVNASRRDGPGQPEVHTLDTDIFYVLEGSATVIVGGELVDPRSIDAHEIRGSAIRGGETHELSPGDVLTIPRGVPHWFKTVRSPFRYYVVKSTAGA
jgi:glc operon protein GlcG